MFTIQFREKVRIVRSGNVQVVVLSCSRVCIQCQQNSKGKVHTGVSQHSEQSDQERRCGANLDSRTTR